MPNQTTQPNLAGGMRPALFAGHTPGPWMPQTSQPNNQNAWHVRNREISRGVCHISRAQWEDTSAEEMEANARLISAAPDMLAALLLAREQLAQAAIRLEQYEQGPIRGAMKAAHSAIEKVKGGTK